MARVADQHQTVHTFHHAAVDLFDPGLAVDDYIIVVAGNHFQHLLEIGVDLAIAAGSFGPADGKEGEIVPLGDAIEQMKLRFAQQRHSVRRFALVDALGDAQTDIVERQAWFDPERGGQPDGRVGVHGKDALLGVLLRQQPDKRGGQRRFADAAFAAKRKDRGLHRYLQFG